VVGLLLNLGKDARIAAIKVQGSAVGVFKGHVDSSGGQGGSERQRQDWVGLSRQVGHISKTSIGKPLRRRWTRVDSYFCWYPRSISCSLCIKSHHSPCTFPISSRENGTHACGQETVCPPLRRGSPNLQASNPILHFRLDLHHVRLLHLLERENTSANPTPIAVSSPAPAPSSTASQAPSMSSPSTIH
jgi:hypothetical protein